MNRAREYYAKRSQSVRGRQIPYDFTRVEFKKQNKQAKEKKKERERQIKKPSLNYREQTDEYQRGSGWGMGKIDGD